MDLLTIAEHKKAHACEQLPRAIHAGALLFYAVPNLESVHNHESLSRRAEARFAWPAADAMATSPLRIRLRCRQRKRRTLIPIQK